MAETISLFPTTLNRKFITHTHTHTRARAYANPHFAIRII